VVKQCVCVHDLFYPPPFSFLPQQHPTLSFQHPFTRARARTHKLFKMVQNKTGMNRFPKLFSYYYFKFLGNMCNINVYQISIFFTFLISMSSLAALYPTYNLSLSPRAVSCCRLCCELLRALKFKDTHVPRCVCVWVK
jgi:hypothetical protein